MTKLEYTIPIQIESQKDKVWETLTDFKKYSEWNSILNLSGNDSLAIGKKFNVVIHDGVKDSKFKAILLSKKESNSFSAEQTILNKWFFSAVHHFIVETVGDKTRFTQHWELNGLISKLFKKQIFKQLELFKQMNHELKTYLEQTNR